MNKNYIKEMFTLGYWRKIVDKLLKLRRLNLGIIGYINQQSVQTKSLLSKHKANPIISPIAKNGWESWQTFNPGVIALNNKVHFLYRAIGEDGLSRFGYASSVDGFHIDERLNYPVYEHSTDNSTYVKYSYGSGGSWGGAEDPRITRVEGEDNIYVTYTACDNGLRVGLASIKSIDFLEKNWQWSKTKLISPPGEVHKNWLIFPEKIKGKYAILHGIKPNIQVEYLESLEFETNQYIKSSYGGAPKKKCWDKWWRGAGAPPLRTKDGWLVFYHAMDNDWSKYKVGVMLLDLANPTKIIRRAKKPVLEPAEPYENNGYKAGIVYVSGAIIKDGKLLIYYGCADSYVGVAHANLNKFLASLKRKETPKLKVKILKGK